MRSVLFVCTANICRSPLAEGLMKAKTSGLPETWQIESAGTWATEGEPASTKSLQVLKERGIDLGSHTSRQVNRDILRVHRLILTMEAGHKEALQIEFPEYADRVYLLSEMAGEQHDVSDPFGSSLQDYQNTAREIDRLLTLGFERIFHLAQE